MTLNESAANQQPTPPEGHWYNFDRFDKGLLKFMGGSVLMGLEGVMFNEPIVASIGLVSGIVSTWLLHAKKGFQYYLEQEEGYTHPKPDQV